MQSELGSHSDFRESVGAMRNRLCEAVARRASVVFQQLYIVGATVDHYIVPEELVEEVCGLIENMDANTVAASSFTPGEMADLREYAALVRRLENQIGFTDDDLSNGMLVETDAWKSIVQASQVVLRGLGFELSIWEEKFVS